MTVTHSQAQTYAVTGTITVANDGEVAVTGVDVTDSIPGATISCGGGGSSDLDDPGQRLRSVHVLRRAGPGGAEQHRDGLVG